MKSIFIAGTDTGVGKTRITELLLAGLGSAFRTQGISLAGMKPIETGVAAAPGPGTSPGDGESLFQLTRALQDRSSDGKGKAVEFHECCPFRFRLPAAPLVAAKHEGRRLNFEELVASIHSLQTRFDCLLIEGAGGLLVPLTEEKLQIDLIRELQTPVILVTRPNLGTLNHTLLSVEALQRRNIPVLGIVINHSRPQTPDAVSNDPSILTNRSQLEAWAKPVPILGEVPFFERTWDLDQLAKVAQAQMDLVKMKKGISE